jgi:limonene-1,2-epoxide hydrolase
MEQERQNIEAVEHLLAGMQNGDVDVVLSELDEDARWIAPSDGHAELCGKAQIGTMLRELSRSYADGMHLIDTTIYADGDHVFAEFTRSPSHDPQAEGAEHNLAVFQLAFGKVCEVREFTLRHN